MDLTIIVTAAYFYDLLLGFRKKERGWLLLTIPGILSLLLSAREEVIRLMQTHSRI